MKMKTRISSLICLAAAGFLMCASLVGVSAARADGASGKKDAAAPTIIHNDDANAMRVQGEARFRANCGRCHAAPRKFPPRMMATVLRHMRVRATITDEDMRLVLSYMSQ
jgi:mono/diheme cytochrome c family protein